MYYLQFTLYHIPFTCGLPLDTLLVVKINIGVGYPFRCPVVVFLRGVVTLWVFGVVIVVIFPCSGSNTHLYLYDLRVYLTNVIL